jgi:hypothetical protein
MRQYRKPCGHCLGALRTSSKTGTRESQAPDSVDSVHRSGRETLRNKVGLVSWSAFSRAEADRTVAGSAACSARNRLFVIAVPIATNPTLAMTMAAPAVAPGRVGAEVVAPGAARCADGRRVPLVHLSAPGSLGADFCERCVLPLRVKVLAACGRSAANRRTLELGRVKSASYSCAYVNF